MKNKIPSSSKNTFFELIKLIEEQNNKNKYKMARTKTTAKAEPKPKTYTLTKEQWEKLKEAAQYAMSIRSDLEDLRGADDLSTIMFEVGKSTYIANKCEDTLDELLGLYDECEYCDDEDDNDM